MPKKVWPIVCFALLCLPLPMRAEDQKIPEEKSQGLEAKGVLRGSGFRISIVHPMRGDFSKYDRLEVVEMLNGVGDRLQDQVKDDYMKKLIQEFQGMGAFAFKEVRVVPESEIQGWPIGIRAAVSSGLETPDQARSEDPAGRADASDAVLSPPAGPRPDSVNVNGASVDSPAAGVPGEPAQAEKGGSPGGGSDAPMRTMVVITESIYYKAGSRGLRALGLGGGYHRFVVRFYLYDKELRQELAMGNISGEVTGGFFSVPLLAGDDDARSAITSALTNRVEVRRAKAGR